MVCGSVNQQVVIKHLIASNHNLNPGCGTSTLSEGSKHPLFIDYSDRNDAVLKVGIVLSDGSGIQLPENAIPLSSGKVDGNDLVQNIKLDHGVSVEEGYKTFFLRDNCKKSNFDGTVTYGNPSNKNNKSKIRLILYSFQQ